VRENCGRAAAEDALCCHLSVDNLPSARLSIVLLSSASPASYVISVRVCVCVCVCVCMCVCVCVMIRHQTRCVSICTFGVHVYAYRVAKTHKLQIIFRKRATNCRALLRKMTYKDKASYASSPPCISCFMWVCGIKRNGYVCAPVCVCVRVCVCVCVCVCVLVLVRVRVRVV